MSSDPFAALFGGGLEPAASSSSGFSPTDLAKLAKLLRGDGNTHVAGGVINYGTKMILPDGMSLEAAVSYLENLIEEMEEVTEFSDTVPVSPYDGAHALDLAIDAVFGLKIQKSSFFSTRKQVKVVVDHFGNTITVPWGEFEVPGLEDGTIETSYAFESGQVVFRITATVKGKFRPKVDELFEKTKEIARTQSIFRGKALEISFTRSDGSRRELPEVKFMNVTGVQKPIYTRSIERKIENDVLVYIRQSEAMRRKRGSIKRGALFAGQPGTGKTLLASYVAYIATEAGMTFIYVPNPADLIYAQDFARLYEDAVVFVEDFETIAGIERTADVNRLLLKLDGVDNKGRNVVTIATTNHPELVSAVMVRPGRMDVLVYLLPPDEEAALRLARHYAKETMDPDGDYTEAARLLAGMIPAIIEEAVARASIWAISRTNGESDVFNGEDLAEAAQAILDERVGMEPVREKTSVQQFGEAVGSSLGEALALPITNLMHQLPQLDAVGASLNGNGVNDKVQIDR